MIKIDPFNQSRYDEIRTRWDQVAKPLSSLGRFEHLIARIGAVHNSADIDISKRAVIIMCADNGVVAEGISQSGQEVTATVAKWMGRGESSVCKMAKAVGTDTIPVDIGMNTAGSPDGVLSRKVRKGTRNFAVEPAMTEEECRKAIRVGIDLVRSCSEKGYKLLAAGEMAIGNTTTSAALTAALLGLEVGVVTGRGAGISTAGLKKKVRVIENALAMYCSEKDRGREDPAFVFKMLTCVGGLDIAGLAGVFIGGALCHVPVIIDGLISAVAALVAERIAPGARHYMLASHQGKEPGMKDILNVLGLEPVIDGMMALGEGTGAVMLIPMLDTALTLYTGGLRFEDTVIPQYCDFESHPEGKMTALIIGYPDSGKSALAEKMVTEISEPDQRIYLATMIPYGKEGRERVERHRRIRRGKGFQTIEAPFDMNDVVDGTAQEKTVLLECVSNLVANELFIRHTDRDEAVDRLYADIRHLSEQCRNLIIVTNHFEIEERFDQETRLYAETLDILNERLSRWTDQTIRM